MALITRAQLEDRLGGPTAARQLLDPQDTSAPDGTGVYNDALDASIADAVGDCEASYSTRYADIASHPTAKLQRIALQLATYYAWGRNPNKVMPETVKQFYGAARADLRDIENSASAPGGDPLSRFPRTIDNSDFGRRAVYSSWRRGGPNGGR